LQVVKKWDWSHFKHKSFNNAKYALQQNFIPMCQGFHYDYGVHSFVPLIDICSPSEKGTA